MRRSAPLATFFATLILYLVTATWYGTVSVDVHATALQAFQLGTQGNLTLDRWSREPGGAFFAADGRIVSNRLPGAVLAAAPFYAASTLIRPKFADVFTLVPGTAAAVVLAAAAAAVLCQLLQRLLPFRAAMAGTVLFAFGTASWSVAADSLWQHSPGIFVLLLAALALSNERWMLAGLALGAAVLCRPHLGVVAAVVVVCLLPRLRAAALISAGAAAGVAGFLLYQRQLYGVWTILGGYGEPGNIGAGGFGLLPFLANVAGALLSPQRGVLIYTPVLVMLLPGLGAAWRTAPSWVRATAVGGVAYTALQLALNRFSGGGAFYSYRLTLELMALSAPLLALAWREWTSQTPTRRTGFAVLAGLSVFVQAIGAVTPTRDHPQTPWVVNDMLLILGAPLTGAVLALTGLLWRLLWVRQRRTGLPR